MDREDVPDPKSWQSITATLSPHEAASRATSAPLHPPPTMRRSNMFDLSLSSLRCWSQDQS